MKTATHGDFKLASKVRINLPPLTFQGGPWTHLATVKRGAFSEYVCLLHEPTQKVYLEQISATGQFYAIEEDELWTDLLNFLFSKGIIGFTKDKEIIQGLNFDK
jgi:hypothetical protein